MAAIVLAGVSIGAAGAQTTSADPLNLSGALNLALENNPITGAARAEIRAAEADALQAGLWDNPTLGAEVEEFGSIAEVSAMRIRPYRSTKRYRSAVTVGALAMPQTLGRVLQARILHFNETVS